LRSPRAGAISEQFGGRVARTIAGGVLAGFGLTWATAAVAAAAPGDGTVPAATLIQQIADGKPIEYDGVTVVGDVDLSSVDTAARIVRCTDCTFTGSIRASNAIFNRVVDLSGADIRGDARFDGAIFRDAFLMSRTVDRAARIHGRTSFTLAAFHGPATFDAIRMDGDADFRVSQFLGYASFANANALGTISFDSSLFEGRAMFGGTSVPDEDDDLPAGVGCPTPIHGTFVGPSSFVSVAFAGKLDARGRCFAGDASFAGATFAAVDFDLARFGGSARFDDVGIEGPASFRAVRVDGALWFRNAALHGPTDFDSATFVGRTDLHGTVASDSLSLEDVTIKSTIGLDQVHAASFRMQLGRLKSLQSKPIQKQVLTMVEATAREQGDLATANDAAFERSSMETDDKQGSEWMAGMLAREVGGYFVRPLYPLRAILALFLLGTLIRFADRTSLRTAIASGALRVGAGASSLRSSNAVPDLPTMAAKGRGAMAGLGMGVGGTFLAMAYSAQDTLRAAFSLKLGSDETRPANGRELMVAVAKAVEWIAYKLLFATFLLGLANSNPTFKQLIEAVKP
jgi:hypothetical protein